MGGARLCPKNQPQHVGIWSALTILQCPFVLELLRLAAAAQSRSIQMSVAQGWPAGRRPYFAQRPIAIFSFPGAPLGVPIAGGISNKNAELSNRPGVPGVPGEEICNKTTKNIDLQQMN